MDQDTIAYTICITSAFIVACVCWKCTPIRSATFDDD